MRKTALAVLLLLPPAVVSAQNVETRVQTRVETQVDTTIKSGSAPTGADISYDEVSFNATGVAKTEKDAAIEAYYTGLSKILRQLAGAQAESEIGQKFKDDMERDFTAFKRRYFTSDTAHICRPLGRDNKPIDEKDKKTPVVSFQCRADGTIKVLALKQDFRREMQATERRLSNVQNFVISYDSSNKDANAPFIADRISSAFTGAGFNVISVSGQNEALSNDKIDYSLAITSIEYAKTEYNQNEQRLEGALTVLFKLNDFKNKKDLAILPTTRKLSVRGAKTPALEQELRSALANAVAQEIGRSTAAAVVENQVVREADEKAKSRAESGQKQYLLRIVGMGNGRNDRARFSEFRKALKEAFPAGAEIEVNPAESNDTRVTMYVTLSPKDDLKKFDPEDVVDNLLKIYDSNKSFDAKYKGNNEFSFTF